MSGHSKWSKIKRDKGANDAKRGAIFTKLGNQIAIAARGGVDPDLNSTLAMAIEKAKAANMPVSNIQRAIDRVADKNSADLQEITYVGYGPGGCAVAAEYAFGEFFAVDGDVDGLADGGVGGYAVADGFAVSGFAPCWLHGKQDATVVYRLND